LGHIYKRSNQIVAAPAHPFFLHTPIAPIRRLHVHQKDALHHQDDTLTIPTLFTIPHCVQRISLAVLGPVLVATISPVATATTATAVAVAVMVAATAGGAGGAVSVVIIHVAIETIDKEFEKNNKRRKNTEALLWGKLFCLEKKLDTKQDL
jgi:hypothetical protein